MGVRPPKQLGVLIITDCRLDVWARGADDQSTDDDSTLFDQLVFCGRKFNLRRLAQKQVKTKKQGFIFQKNTELVVFGELRDEINLLFPERSGFC